LAAQDAPGIRSRAVLGARRPRNHREDYTMNDNAVAGGSTGPVEKTNKNKELCILFVDDSATIRRSAETMLASESYRIVTAENGFEALSKISRHRPDLIFVDIMMPRLDGYQTTAIIKNNAEFRKTPVIMLTSKDGLFDKARGRVVGSDLYLTKPFTREELLNAVQQHAA
jgi:twitching motility two-component system response regulator PilG